MVTVSMPEDIRQFETKFIGNFTLRQVVCLAVGAVFAIPTALLIPTDIMYKIIVAALVEVPFLFAGWAKPQGMRFEVFVMRMIYYYVLTPRVRKVKEDNPYYDSYRKVLAAKEKAKLKKMSDKERNAYLKQKKNGTIKRSNKAQYKVYQ